MTLSLRQTDSAAVDGSSIMCNSAVLADTPGSRQATDGGTPGSTPVSVTFAAQSVLRSTVMFESAAGEPNSTSWEAGDYVVRLNVTTAVTGNGQWRETHICRCNSSGVSQASVGSLTGQTTDITSTGVKTHTVSGAAQGSASATDRVYIVLVFVSTNKTPRTMSFTPDQLIDTPLTGGGGGGGGGGTRRSMLGFFWREEPREILSRRGRRLRRKAMEMFGRVA